MKNFFFKFKFSILALIVLILVSYIFFPYLFSNKQWVVKEELVVKNIDWKTELIGTANDYPDTKIIYCFYGEDGKAKEVVYPLDVLDGSSIEQYELVYLYALKDDVACLSHSSQIKDYSARWNYYWCCDFSPVKTTIVFLLMVVFLASVVAVVSKDQDFYE